MAAWAFACELKIPDPQKTNLIISAGSQNPFCPVWLAAMKKEAVSKSTASFFRVEGRARTDDFWNHNPAL
jgi:hypothetical protein